jgi:hypothetical protein
MRGESVWESADLHDFNRQQRSSMRPASLSGVMESLIRLYRIREWRPQTCSRTTTYYARILKKQSLDRKNFVRHLTESWKRGRKTNRSKNWINWLIFG